MKTQITLPGDPRKPFGERWLFYFSIEFIARANTFGEAEEFQELFFALAE